MPESLRDRFQNGDPSVLEEILRTHPELFRNELLGRLEDDAFRKLLSKTEHSK